MAIETPELGIRLLIRQMIKEELGSLVQEEFKAIPLERHTIDVVPLQKSGDIWIDISNLLREFAIPANLLGYKYIREAVVMGLENPDNIDYITKKLYPLLAIKYQTTGARVERAIRHAIEVSWIRGDRDFLRTMFKYLLEGKHPHRPTNKEFISTILDKFRLERG